MHDRGPVFRWVALLPVLLMLSQSACDGAEEEPACAFTGDGVCDEPANCPLGTDEDDCVAACAGGENLHLFAAACALRDPPQPAPDDGDSSNGTGHLTGYRDDTVVVPDGEDLGDTVERHYRLYVPRFYDPDVTHPLVLMLPGHRVSHYSLASYTELPRVADEMGFLLVDAEQQWRWSGEHRWAWFTDWDWDGPTAEANPDFDYILAVIDQVSSEYNVDRSRIYLVGHSRGAAMSFIGSIELSDVVAGACVQSGFTEFGYLDDRLSTWDGRKVPMVFMHGVDDPDVGITHGDRLVDRLDELGWEEGEDYLYYRLENVTHRWQPWLNPIWWEFLYQRPLPGGE